MISKQWNQLHKRCVPHIQPASQRNIHSHAGRVPTTDFSQLPIIARASSESLSTSIQSSLGLLPLHQLLLDDTQLNPFLTDRHVETHTQRLPHSTSLEMERDKKTERREIITLPVACIQNRIQNVFLFLYPLSIDLD